MVLIQPAFTEVFVWNRNQQQYTVSPDLEVHKRAIYVLVSLSNGTKL